MRIINIELNNGIYSVTRKPNWVESLFRIKERIDKYKDSGYTYTFGRGSVYVDTKGRQLGNHFGYRSNTRETIDRWRNQFD